MRTGEETADPRARVRMPTYDLTWDDLPPRGGWRLLRAVLIVAMLVLVAVGAVVGERPSSLGHLQGAVAAGEVDVVHVEGGLPLGATGYGMAEVTWRRGWVTYRAEVVEARPRSEGRGVHRREDTPVVRDVEAQLTDVRPDLRIIRTDHATGSYSSVLGWRLPGWMGWTMFVLLMATMVLLALGPQPWRATRGAWFWLCFLAAPVGIPAFLLLGGPSRVVPPPRAGAGRLTGGWGFLLALFLSASLPPAG